MNKFLLVVFLLFSSRGQALKALWHALFSNLMLNDNVEEKNQKLLSDFDCRWNNE